MGVSFSQAVAARAAGRARGPAARFSK